MLAGIEAAAAAGLGPIKINMVVKRGVNEDGVVPMARHFRGSGHVVRFIEYMDVGHTNGWRMDDVVPAAEIVAMIDAELPLEPVAPNYPGEVVERWRYSDGSGEIGVIASVTRPFCGGCTRARLSADGRLFTCLFAIKGHDLRALLRDGASDAEIAASIGSDLARAGRPLLGTAHGRDGRAAEGRDVLHRRVARQRVAPPNRAHDAPPRVASVRRACVKSAARAALRRTGHLRTSGRRASGGWWRRGRRSADRVVVTDGLAGRVVIVARSSPQDAWATLRGGRHIRGDRGPERVMPQRNVSAGALSGVSVAAAACSSCSAASVA